jgi:hypothetical protein
MVDIGGIAYHHCLNFPFTTVWDINIFVATKKKCYHHFSTNEKQNKLPVRKMIYIMSPKFYLMSQNEQNYEWNSIN